MYKDSGLSLRGACQHSSCGRVKKDRFTHLEEGGEVELWGNQSRNFWSRNQGATVFKKQNKTQMIWEKESRKEGGNNVDSDDYFITREQLVIAFGLDRARSVCVCVCVCVSFTISNCNYLVGKVVVMSLSHLFFCWFFLFAVFHIIWLVEKKSHWRLKHTFFSAFCFLFVSP
jgi:hypothetical protein